MSSQISSSESAHTPTMLCISIHPAPCLITPGDDLLHSKGLSFEKHHLANLLKDMVEENRLSARIPADDSLSDNLLHSRVLLYFGKGMGCEKSSAGKMNQNSHLLLNCQRLPSIVFICMKYGAKGFAECLSKAANATNVHSICWMKPTPKNLYGNCKGIFEFLKSVLSDGVSNLEKLEVALSNTQKSVFGFVPGRAHNSFQLPKISLSKQGRLYTHSSVDLVPNNIFDQLQRDELNQSFLGVLSCDKALVGEVLTAIDTIPMITIHSDNEDEGDFKISNKHNLLQRHRSVSFEVTKRCIFMKSFSLVLRIFNSDQLKQLLTCLNTNNFSSFGITESIDSRIFVWVDLKSQDQVPTGEVLKLLDHTRCHVLLVVDQGSLPAFVKNDKRIRKMDLPECDSETLNTLASDHHDEIVLDLIPKDKDSVVKIDCSGFASALQGVLCDGIDVVAVYDGDDNQLFARVSIADVESLQNLFGLVLIDTFGIKLKEQLNDKCPILLLKNDKEDGGINDDDDDWSISVNFSCFAELFQNSMFSLDNLTPLQSEVLTTCKTIQRVHITGPAGCGKTFVALQKMKQMILRKVKVLFIARNKSLCLNVIEWLFHRVGKWNLQAFFFVSFAPFGDTSVKHVRRIIVEGQSTSSSPSITKLVDYTFESHWFWEPLEWFYLVIDEAHHLYTAKAPKRSTLMSSYREPSLLHDILAPYKHLAGLMMLSDTSQSTGLAKIDNHFHCTNMQLKEVVRSSQKIMCGARCFATGDYDVQCQHDVHGSPLRVQIFPVLAPQVPGILPQLTQDETIRRQLYTAEVVKAIQFYRYKFLNFAFTGRIAIVVDANYLDMKEDIEVEINREGVGREDGPRLVFVEAHENRDPELNVEQLVFDTIDNLDGLEYLFVIAVGLDRLVSEGNEARSRIYRSITRAQMMFTIVNHYLPDGWLEFLLNVKLSSLFEGLDAAEERFKVKPDVVKKVLNSVSKHPAVAQLLSTDQESVQLNNLPVVSSTLPPIPCSTTQPASTPFTKTNRPDVYHFESPVWDTSPSTVEPHIELNPDPLFMPLRDDQAVDQMKLEKRLLTACSRSDTKSMMQLKELIALGVDVNCIDEENGNCSPAFMAANSNSAKALILLAEISANFNIPCTMHSPQGQTALQVAESKGFDNCVNVINLVNQLNRIDQDPNMLLLKAVKHQCHEGIKHLIQCRANLDERDKDGNTPLILAVMNGYDTCMDILLAAGAKEPVDKAGNTILLLAAKHGHYNCLERLFASGANIETMDEDGNTLLLVTTINGHDACIEQLLEAGANKEAANKDGDTALTIAANKYAGWWAEKYERCLSRLLQAGANKEFIDKDGNSPLLITAMKGHWSCMEILIKAGVNIEAIDKDGRTSLLIASIKGYDRSLKLLMEAGANTEATDKDGNTALLLAAMNVSYPCVKLLLEAGANKDATNKDGMNAQQMSQSNGSADCFGLLL